MPSAKETALGLPEIRTYIGHHLLDPFSIQSCRLVNHPWSQSFSPFFWQHIHLHRQDSSPSTLFQNTCLIQHLTLQDFCHPDIAHLKGLHNLQELDIYRMDQDEPTFQLSLTFIRYQCSNLRSITIACSETVESKEFWKAVAKGCPALQSLALRETNIAAVSFKEMWRAIAVTGVEDLSLDILEVEDWNGFDFSTLELQQPLSLPKQQHNDEDGEDSDDEEKDGMVTKVRRLHISERSELPGRDILYMMQLCPEAEDFLCPQMSSSELDLFRRMLERGVWKMLSSFDSGLVHVQDEPLASVIKAMPVLRRLSLSQSKFGRMAYEALQSHDRGFSRIQVLNLDGCTEATSAMTRMVLEECGKLVELSANVLESKDIVGGEPWVCAGTLKKLEVLIIMSEYKTRVKGKKMNGKKAVEEETRAVLSRIATLTELETLNIAPSKASGGNFQLNLKQGLGVLKTLEKLRQVDLTWCSLFMTAQDLVWMMDCWPRLQKTDVLVQNLAVLAPELMARLWNRQITYRRMT